MSDGIVKSRPSSKVPDVSSAAELLSTFFDEIEAGSRQKNPKLVSAPAGPSNTKPWNEAFRGSFSSVAAEPLQMPQHLGKT